MLNPSMVYGRAAIQGGKGVVLVVVVVVVVCSGNRKRRALNENNNKKLTFRRPCFYSRGLALSTKEHTSSSIFRFSGYTSAKVPRVEPEKATWNLKIVTKMGSNLYSRYLQHKTPAKQHAGNSG